MCGITGFISTDRTEPIVAREALLTRMCETLHYRGPDEMGTLIRDRAALGMRRLSIIDIKSGQQPIFNKNKDLAIVFNGEIYNFQELRKELITLGGSFRTNSDTEVIVRAYEAFGPDCVNRLRGMFAFAIWDFHKEKLFLARDRLGKKPLFYTLTPTGEFIFGSELKALLEHPCISREIEHAALDAYMTFGYVPEEFCIFKRIKKLLPGHHLTFTDGVVKSEKYWDVDLSKADNSRSEAEWTEILREKIRESVSVRLVSEVPLGAFLSGGIDSSAIVGMMTGLSPEPVRTFSIGFNEDSFDELKFARIAAKKFGTEHHEFIVTPDLFELVDQIVHHFDEPFADQSSLPTFMLAKLAREYVTVVLSGDGGDELFAGYSRYLIDQRRNNFALLPAIVRDRLIRPISKAMPHWALGKNYLFHISLSATDRYIDNISVFNAPKKSYLYSREFAKKVNGNGSSAELQFVRFSKAMPADDPVARRLYLDTKTYLPGDILTKVDRMTMANSIEARAPFLDHELVELVSGIPSRFKMSQNGTKYILRKAVKDLVPSEILNRKKQGFGVPIGQWINDQLKDRIREELCESRTTSRGYFDEKYVMVLIDEHSTGRRDHSTGLWMLWMLERWFRQYIDR